MGCNCKTENKFETPEKFNFFGTTKLEKIKLIGHYTLKFIGFLIGVLLLPIINIAIIVFMFNTIVLTKEVSMVNILKRFATKKFNDDYDDDDYDDDDFENLTEDDVIMMDVEDITEKN